MHEHMEDMLDDYLESGEEREAAIEKVIKDMGDPVKINKQLRRAHRSEIISACAARAFIAVSVIALLLFLPYLDAGLSEYSSSTAKEEIEADLAKSEYSYKYYGKTERNGRDYIFYAAETPEGYKVKYYESIKLFNRYSVYDRFAGSGDKPNEIKSELFPVPKTGEFTVIDAPEGYRFSGFYYLFDENKQKIQGSKNNDFWDGTAWNSSSKASYNLR